MRDNIVTFASGARRSADVAEERWDLMPTLGLWRVARTSAEGAMKYGEGNWLKGIPVRDYLNHAIRHIALWLAGDRTEDHLAHAAWNLLAACHTELIWPELSQCAWQSPWKDVVAKLDAWLATQIEHSSTEETSTQ